MFGYQGGLSDDGDPNTESLLLGETVKKTPISANGYSVVYLETIRDRKFADVHSAAFANLNNIQTLRDQYLQMSYIVLAHEIGHAPGDHGEGADHAEGELMKSGPPDVTTIYTGNVPALRFSPATVKRFRSATKWAE